MLQLTYTLLFILFIATLIIMLGSLYFEERWHIKYTTVIKIIDISIVMLIICSVLLALTAIAIFI